MFISLIQPNEGSDVNMHAWRCKMKKRIDEVLELENVFA